MKNTLHGMDEEGGGRKKTPPLLHGDTCHYYLCVFVHLRLQQ